MIDESTRGGGGGLTIGIDAPVPAMPQHLSSRFPPPPAFQPAGMPLAPGTEEGTMRWCAPRRRCRCRRRRGPSAATVWADAAAAEGARDDGGGKTRSVRRGGSRPPIVVAAEASSEPPIAVAPPPLSPRNIPSPPSTLVVDCRIPHSDFRRPHTSVFVMIRAALGTGGRLRRSEAIVGGNKIYNKYSGVVTCGEEREREFRAILKFSSQDTTDSSLDLCTIFLAVKESKNLEK